MIVKRPQATSTSSSSFSQVVKSDQKMDCNVAQSPSPKLTKQPPNNKAKHPAATENNKENQSNKSPKTTAFVNGVNLNSLKFVKPAPQCPKWDKPKHRKELHPHYLLNYLNTYQKIPGIEEPHCPLWHPRVVCQYYPNCQLTAEVCGYAHPFCADVCKCDSKNRSLQKNHNIVGGQSNSQQQEKGGRGAVESSSCSSHGAAAATTQQRQPSSRQQTNKSCSSSEKAKKKQHKCMWGFYTYFYIFMRIYPI